jgi:hypothetical protein
VGRNNNSQITFIPLFSFFFFSNLAGLETATVHIIANTTHQFFFLSFVLYPTGWQKLLLW